MSEYEIEQNLDENQENQNINDAEISSPESETSADFAPAKKSKIRFFVDGGIYAFLLVFGIAIMCSVYIFQVWLKPIKVVGLSMYPTLNYYATSNEDEEHCDIVYYNKDKSYKNNDIVIIENKNERYVKNEIDLKTKEVTSIDFLIKRVVACPGQTLKFYLTEMDESSPDTIYYYNIAVFENGVDINLEQPYLKQDMSVTRSFIEATNNIENIYIYSPFFYNIFSTIAKNEIYEYNVHNNEYFVMGDNRDNSRDSRFFGAVEYDDITGCVKLTVVYGQNIFQAIWIKIKSSF